MTSQEASFYVGVGFVAISFVIGGLGALADEKGHKDLAKGLLVGAFAGLGLAAGSFLKWLLMFIF